MRSEVYLDHNASAPVRPEARAAVLEAMGEGLANPSSIHARGHRAKILIEAARESVAALLGARAEEIVFTSGGTESNNLALLGAAISSFPRWNTPRCWKPRRSWSGRGGV
jgi:cysteine desulfurase